MGESGSKPACCSGVGFALGLAGVFSSGTPEVPGVATIEIGIGGSGVALVDGRALVVRVEGPGWPWGGVPGRPEGRYRLSSFCSVSTCGEERSLWLWERSQGAGAAEGRSVQVMETRGPLDTGCGEAFTCSLRPLFSALTASRSSSCRTLQRGNT